MLCERFSYFMKPVDAATSPKLALNWFLPTLSQGRRQGKILGGAKKGPKIYITGPEYNNATFDNVKFLPK